MSNMRYRKPSVKSLLGLTLWKKRIKKALGINKLLWPFRAVNNYQRRMLRRAGYYSPELKMLRAAKRGQAPGPIGPLQIGEGEHEGGKGLDNSALLMAAMLAQGEHKAAGGAHKKGGNASNLAEAMLLASALKGTNEAKAAHEHAAPVAAHRRAQRGSRAKSKRAEEKPASKNHRGARIFGLVLLALGVAAAIVAVWYYWVL